MDQSVLIEQARRGDRRAFDRLAAAAMPAAKAVVRRMVGNREDSEDIVQEALLKAFGALGEFRGESAFDTWLVSIATNLAIDHLRRAGRWRAQAQIAHANLCAADEEMSGAVVSAFAAPDAAFELRQHVAYCFTCVGRSLPPDELAVLVLRDVVEMSGRDATIVLGISDAVMRHRLASARAAMQDRFEGLCSLVSKQGMCHQCKGLSEVAKGFGGTPGPLPDVADLADRMAIVRDMRDRPASDIHALFFDQVGAIERAGAGDVTPQSDCGLDEEETAPLADS